MTCVRMCSTPVQQDASSYCYKPCDSHSDIHKTFDSQSDINNIDLEQKVKKLKKKLTVDRKNTSSRYIWKFFYAPFISILFSSCRSFVYPSICPVSS